MSGATIPVTIVTGFLGAGKTTLINRLLDDPAVRGTAVIVNEFGEIAIDHLLVRQSAEEIVELAGGCLCCTVRGELTDTLCDLVGQMQAGEIGRLNRIIIETTGMADPVPVLHAVQSHPALVHILRLERVITVVDAKSGLAILDAHGEARRQAATADLLLLSKSDLADERSVRALKDRLRTFTGASIIDAATLTAPVSELLDCAIAPAVSRASASSASGHSHDRQIRSVSLMETEPLAQATIEMFLDQLCTRHGDRILRVKGVACAKEQPHRPLVIHAVQRVISPVTHLDRWPSSMPPATHIVVIGDDLDSNAIVRLFRTYAGRPQADTPDRTALEHNPLAIPGAG